MRKLLLLALALASISGIGTAHSRPSESAAGNYQGTFQAPGSLSGAINFTLTSSGIYTGKIRWCGFAIPFRGKYSQSEINQFVLEPKIGGIQGMTLRFVLDPNAGSPRITGTLWDSYAVEPAPFIASRHERSGGASHGVTRYTCLLIAPDSNNNPEVFGSATVTETGGGKLIFNGAYYFSFQKIAFVASAERDSDNMVRFYTPVNTASPGMNGALSGELLMEENTTYQFAGLMHLTTYNPWFDSYDRSDVAMLGSRYERPKGNGPLLPSLVASNGLANLEINSVMGSGSGAVSVLGHKVVDSERGVKMIFNPANGAFTGTLWNGELSKNVPIQGVVFQAQDAAWGCYAINGNVIDGGQISLLPLARTIAADSKPLLVEGVAGSIWGALPAGSYGITKQGAGNLVFSSSETYSGSTGVSGGTLDLDFPIIAVGPGGSGSGSGSYAGITKQGQGTVTLSSGVTFTGSTSVSGGTLNLGSAGSVVSSGSSGSGSGAVMGITLSSGASLYSGGTLVMTGTRLVTSGTMPVTTGTHPVTSGTFSYSVTSEQEVPVTNF